MLLSHSRHPCCTSHQDPCQTLKSFLTLNLHVPWLLEMFSKLQNSASSHLAQKLLKFPTTFRRKPKPTGPSQSDLVSFLLHLQPLIPRVTTLPSSRSFSLLLPPHASGGQHRLHATSGTAHISLPDWMPFSHHSASQIACLLQTQIKCHLC